MVTTDLTLTGHRLMLVTSRTGKDCPVGVQLSGPRVYSALYRLYSVQWTTLLCLVTRAVPIIARTSRLTNAHERRKYSNGKLAERCHHHHQGDVTWSSFMASEDNNYCFSFYFLLNFCGYKIHRPLPVSLSLKGRFP